MINNDSLGENGGGPGNDFEDIQEMDDDDELNTNS
jgi:hypothetical protein